MKYRNVVAASAMLFTVIPLAALADLRVVASDEKTEILIDVDTIKDVEGSHHEAWFITTYNEIQKLNDDGPTFRISFARIFFRCMDATGSISKLILFTDEAAVKAKTPVAKFDYPVIWKPVDIKTDVGLMWKYVCTKGWERD
jgi:hypothetical protein